VTEPLVLGRYRVVRRLAQGGMGVVYLGRLEGGAGFSKAVIIKRVLPDLDQQPDHTARFIREAQILSQLQHPCIVGVLDFGETESGYAMVLEYMHGYDLGRWLKYLQLSSTLMPWEQAIFIILRALDGLHYAHTMRRSDGTAAGVLHRDISPGNILLDLEGQIRLLDFGIARALQGDADQYKTRDGALSGKTGYLAPELFSAGASSVASDIYACAVVLYMMLAGVHPFTADSDGQTMWRVLQEMPAPLTAFRSDLPAELNATLFRSLAKDPQQRHPSAERFAQELRKLLTRSESDLLLELRQRLRCDFTGKMPELLGIEPLAARDKAWRVVQGPAAIALQSSQFPPALGAGQVTVVARPIAATPPGPVPEESPSPTPAKAGAAITARAREPSTKLGWGLGLGLGLGLVVLLLLRLLAPRREEHAAAGPMIVVASPERRDVPLVTVAPPEPAASGATEESSTIFRQLARRQVALQACFQGSSGGARDTITIGFDVAASGQVTGATLEPAALAATPVGQCLLGVAQGTQFEGLLHPVHFSVPLHARVLVK
jgi:serine/threonine protein kinase